MTKTATHHRSRISAHSNGRHDDGLKGLISEARSTIGNVGDHASENLQALKSRFNDSLVGVRARAKTLAKAARRHAGRADDKIRANPYQAMFVAAAIGVLTGLLLARRRAIAR